MKIAHYKLFNNQTVTALALNMLDFIDIYAFHFNFCEWEANRIRSFSLRASWTWIVEQGNAAIIHADQLPPDTSLTQCGYSKKEE